MLRSKPTLGLIAILLGIFLGLGSCEKDDICVDGDTPLLVVGFFDQADAEQETAKDVTTLRIREVNSSGFPPSVSDRVTTDSIAIPLPNSATTVTYLLISNSADTDGNETGNIDTLDMSYTLSQRFVSRACGFVAVYEDLTVSLRNDSSNWIQDLVVVDSTVNSNNSIQLKVLH